MDPYDPYADSSHDAPSTGLPAPAMDDPPRLPGDEAFAIGRAFGNAVAALKHATWPMLLAGLLMAILDGGGSGNLPSGNGGGGYEDDYDYDDYSQVIESIGEPTRAAVTDTFGDLFGPPATLLQIDPDLAALAAVGIGAILCVAVIVIVFWVARSFIKPGVIRLHSHILQTAEEQSFRIIFSGSDRFVAMLLWELLAAAILFAAIVVASIPAGVVVGVSLLNDGSGMPLVAALLVVVVLLPVLFYVGLGLSLGAHAVTLEERSPIEALKRSWALASGNRWALFLFYLVAGLIQIAALIVGVLLCCVGLVATIPAARAVTDFATTESFLLLTRGREVSAYWKFWELRASGLV